MCMTGRPARGFVNRVMRELGPISPVAPEFPLAGGALAPLGAKAQAQGSGDFSSMWAGQAPALGTALPAARPHPHAGRRGAGADAAHGPRARLALRGRTGLCYTRAEFSPRLAPMSVDAATVRRIAHLARIAVADDEVEHLKGELNAILAFVEQLSEVDVDGRRADDLGDADGDEEARRRGHRRRHRRGHRQERAGDAKTTSSWCRKWWNDHVPRL